MTKLALNAPAYCSVCYQAGGEKRYIDFEASYDGPVIPGSPEPVPVDDLVICEGCIAEAFALMDPDGLKAENARLQDVLENAVKSDEAKDRMIERLEMTLAELVHNPVQRRGGGTQHYVAIPDDIRKALNKRRKQRKEGQFHNKKKQQKVGASE